MLRKVGKVSYKLQLPTKLKTYPIFHVSMLKPYHGDKEHPSREESKRDSTTVVTSFEKEVQSILANRLIHAKGSA